MSTAGSWAMGMCTEQSMRMAGGTRAHTYHLRV